jgi:hypothetical protein
MRAIDDDMIHRLWIWSQKWNAHGIVSTSHGVVNLIVIVHLSHQNKISGRRLPAIMVVPQSLISILRPCIPVLAVCILPAFRCLQAVAKKSGKQINC